MVRQISGADGCKSGWVVVSQDLDTGAVSWRLAPTARDLIHGKPMPVFLAIDIPIGLTEGGARSCDMLARRTVGPRASSVFPAPIRPALAAETREEASRIREAIEGKKMSCQAWAIVPKIREVDEVLGGDPRLQLRVREVHPEVCFCYLAGGRPLLHGKKSAAGRAERLALLNPVFGSWVQAALYERRRLASQADDILDAFAALWSARRILEGTAAVLPSEPPLDSRGLRMEIVA
jgi:predicted RNase H-like nuclease